MLRLRALRISTAPRWTMLYQRPRAAFMATLPGMSEGEVLKEETPASPDTAARAPPPHMPSAVTMSQFFAASMVPKIHEDPELKAFDTSQPPVGSAYPPPSTTPPKTNPVKTISEVTDVKELRHYGLHVKSTRNNTWGDMWVQGTQAVGVRSRVHVRDEGHRVPGELKVKEPKMKVNLFLKGFGQGRDAVHKALISSEGEVVRNAISRVTDITPAKIGGTRAKKRRRL
ncbi:hypothetical protein BXZ70DRAFT_1004550 [Cristinia sonorae]|uniref:Ribosomal protein S11 n=1 Tax=Cristinia sonorae TaxID=1940300 RepID=A0A8K0XU39_9AGAR|nr:hypothetical protein BXZ70DRAFT_1004550 [Cristinia sonorae]